VDERSDKVSRYYGGAGLHIYVITMLPQSLKIGDVVVLGVLYTVKENNAVYGNYVFVSVCD
jgi:hypothetical protein